MMNIQVNDDIDNDDEGYIEDDREIYLCAPASQPDFNIQCAIFNIQYYMILMMMLILRMTGKSICALHQV